jgi:cell division septation protein DedD
MNHIKQSVRTVASNFLKQDVKINENLDKILEEKFEKVQGDENKYFELLKYNILFYKTISRSLEPIIGKWIKEKYISSEDELNRDLEIITGNCRKYINKAMKEDINQLMPEDFRSFIAYDRIEFDLKKQRLEKDYKVLNIYKDILSIFIRKISINRDDYEFIFDLNYVDVKRELKKELILCVNNILSSSKENKEEIEDKDLSEGIKNIDYEQQISLVSEEDIPNDEQIHRGLNDVEIAYLTKIGNLTKQHFELYIRNGYDKLLKLENVTDKECYGFSEGSIVDFVSGVILLDFLNKKNKSLIEGAMRLTAVGEMGANDFIQFTNYVVKNRTILSGEVWKEAKKIVSKTYKDIESNELAKKESNDDRDINVEKFIEKILILPRSASFKESFIKFSEEEDMEDYSFVDSLGLELEETQKGNIINGLKYIEPQVLLKQRMEEEKIKQQELEEQAKVEERQQEIERQRQKKLEEQKEKERRLKLEEEKLEKERQKRIEEEKFEKEKEKRIEEEKLEREKQRRIEEQRKAEEERKLQENRKNLETNKKDEKLNDTKVVNYSNDFIAEDEDEDDESEKTGSKKVRDTIIAVVVVIAVVVIYFVSVGLKNKKANEDLANSNNTNTTSQSETKDKEKSEPTPEEKYKAEKEARLAEIEKYADDKGLYYRVYAGSFKTEEEATKTLESYQKKGVEASIIQDNGYYKINAGEFVDRTDATAKTKELASKSIETYIEKYDKYYELKLVDFKESLEYESPEEIDKVYDDLLNELSDKKGVAYKEYTKQLKEMYENKYVSPSDTQSDNQ